MNIQRGKPAASSFRGEVHCERRSVHEVQRRKTFSAEKTETSTAGDAAAATPIDERTILRRAPSTQAKFPEHCVPLPADALGVGKIVVREIAERSPIGSAGFGGCAA